MIYFISIDLNIICIENNKNIEVFEQNVIDVALKARWYQIDQTALFDLGNSYIKF